VRVVGRAAVACLVLLSVAACSRLHARQPAAIVTLEMSPPPAPLLIPVELTEPIVEAEPEPEPAPPPAPPSRPRDTSTAARPAQQTPPPSAAPPATDAPASAVLQTTTNVAAVERDISAKLAAAARDLDRVLPKNLSPSERVQYDQAWSFIRRAHDAIRIKNYMYAESLATKAATLAGLLLRG
jgi:hypothetical protein